MAVSWRHAIVVGASSGIGAAVARELVGVGCSVALVARREALLRDIAKAVADVRSGTRALVYVHDVTHYGEVPVLFQEICRDLGGLDLVCYAAGVMPRIEPAEYSFDKDRQIVEVNVLGAIAWLNQAAERFGRTGEGTIVGLSSAAGDRGRRGNPVYCASKAALDTYLEALRNRLALRGVAVVTVKLGPVDTPMTQGLPRSRLPFLIPADVAAKAILRAARRQVTTAYVPRRWRPIMLVIRNLPSVVMRRLDI